MGCSGSKLINVNITIFQILQKYPKIHKVTRESLDLKNIRWRTWLTCFQNDIYPIDFLSLSSEKMITQNKVAILIEPIWSCKRRIIIFYRDDCGNVAIEHIPIPTYLFENPIEVIEKKDIIIVDDKIKKILATCDWFFLMQR